MEKSHLKDIIMRKLLLVLAFIMTSLTYAQLIPWDKQLHIGAGGSIAVSSRLIVNDVTQSNKKAWIWSMGLVTLAGLSKEIYDEIDYGGFDVNDLGFTILSGLVVNTTIEIFRKKDKRRKK